MSEQPATGRRRTEQLKSYGFFISAALGLLTALSPLFGEDGLLELLPMPVDLDAVGPPLATTVSLFLLMAIFISLSGRDRSRVPAVGALLSFLTAITLISLYLSWVENGELVGSQPVASLLVIVAGIGALTSAFAFLGVTLLQQEEPLTPEETARAAPGPALKAHGEPDQTRDSLWDLYSLVESAEWEEIRRRTARGHRFGYWRLFHNVADFVLSQGMRERKRAVASAQAWTRVLRAFSRVIPSFLGFDKRMHVLLDGRARELILVERQRQEIAKLLSNPELSRSELLHHLIRSFITTLHQPPAYGLDRIYFEAKRDAQKIRQTTKALEPVQRLQLAQVSNLYSGDWEPHSSRSSRSVMAGIFEERNSFQQAVKEALLRGKFHHAVQLGLDFWKKMQTETKSLPDASVGHYLASEFMVQGPCAAAAIAGSELTQENLMDYAQAMVYLCHGAHGRTQLSAVCELTAEYERLVGPLLSHSESKGVKTVITPALAKLRDGVGAERGAPCVAVEPEEVERTSSR